MLQNPFTPSAIASAPDDFFGRRDELKTFERSIRQGFVAIQGPMGIGKSSLLARARLLMEGFDSDYKHDSVIAVGHKGIVSMDDAARALLESVAEADETSSKVRFKIGNLLELESGELVKLFVQGRHLAALTRIVERRYQSQFLPGDDLLLLAVDEADKCPRPFAQLIRALATHAQQQGVKNVRFVVAGVSPFFHEMVDEDQGISRFFYKTITLQPMSDEEAFELIETKLQICAEEAATSGIDLRIDPQVVKRIVALSGGHPHLLQLLGSHVVEHEDADPDNIIDAKDLAQSLRRICMDDRFQVYDSTISMLEMYDKLDAIETLFSLMPPGFPSRVDKKIAVESVGQETMHWLLQRNILAVRSDEEYGLVDEFLRIRLLLEAADSETGREELERHLIEGAIVGHPYFDEPPELEAFEGEEDDED